MFGLGVMELTILLAIVGMLAAALLYLRTLSQTLASVSPSHRKMAPELVWLNLIPLFNFLWHFYVVLKIRESLAAELKARGLVDVDRHAWLFGIAASILHLLTLVPAIGPAAVIVGYGCWIAYWSKIAGYKSRLALLSTGNKAPHAASQQLMTG